MSRGTVSATRAAAPSVRTVAAAEIEPATYYPVHPWDLTVPAAPPNRRPAVGTSPTAAPRETESSVSGTSIGTVGAIAGDTGKEGE